MLLAIGAANTGSLSLASFLCNENFLIFLQVSRPAGPADGNYEEAWDSDSNSEAGTQALTRRPQWSPYRGPLLCRACRGVRAGSGPGFTPLSGRDSEKHQFPGPNSELSKGYACTRHDQSVAVSHLREFSLKFSA